MDSVKLVRCLLKIGYPLWNGSGVYVVHGKKLAYGVGTIDPPLRMDSIIVMDSTIVIEQILTKEKNDA